MFQETLNKIVSTHKELEQLKEAKSRTSKLFSYPVPATSSPVFIEIGGGSVHCRYFIDSREDADTIQKALESVWDAKIAELETYLKAVIVTGE